MSEPIDIQKEMMKAIVHVSREKEFYGHIIQQFDKRFVRNPHPIDTAAVGRAPGERFVKLYINENYFEGLFAEYLDVATNSNARRDATKKATAVASGAMEHEIIHVVMDHIYRDFDDRLRGNIAMDCVVNQNISSERLHPTWIMPERYGLQRGQTAAWYYDQLKDNQQYKDDVASGKYGNFPSHSMWAEIGGDPITHEIIKDIVRKAVENTSAEGWGNVSSDIKSSIESLLENKKPKVPWAKVFRDFCASAIDSDLSYTMSRISRRFGTRPGTRKQDVLNIAVIIDTSGSISDIELAAFFNEVRWIWRNGAEVTIFEADTKVQRSYKFKGRFDGSVSGRGGTNLAPGLEAAEAGRFDAAVYFTDFEAAKLPRRYRLPVLWVLSRTPDKQYWPCDWGRVIEIDAA